jgi:hypothetical protein
MTPAGSTRWGVEESPPGHAVAMRWHRAADRGRGAGPRLAQATLASEVIFTDRVFVRHRRRGGTWVNWNPSLGGGPVVRVRRRSVEIHAPQGMLLETRHIVMLSESTSMRHDRIGLWGLPVRRRDCILLVGRDVSAWYRRLAISSEDIPALWDALHHAGVAEIRAAAAHSRGAETGRE